MFCVLDLSKCLLFIDCLHWFNIGPSPTSGRQVGGGGANLAYYICCSNQFDPDRTGYSRTAEHRSRRSRSRGREPGSWAGLGWAGLGCLAQGYRCAPSSRAAAQPHNHQKVKESTLVKKQLAGLGGARRGGWWGTCLHWRGCGGAGQQ